MRLHQQVRRIYELYQKTNNLGLLITDGPHSDTQDLQLPVFRWFNRFLKGEDPPIEMAAKRFFDPQQLRVFETLPPDQLNTRIQQIFPSTGSTNSQATRAPDLQVLRDSVFGGWPEDESSITPELVAKEDRQGIRRRHYTLTTQTGVELSLIVLQDSKVRKPREVVLEVLDSTSWTNSAASFLWLGGETVQGIAELRQTMQHDRCALAFFAPRLVEPAKAFSDKAKWNQIRRRYMLLGQTLDGMRVWDIRCGAQALKSLPEFRNTRLVLRAQGPMGVNAAYAALFEPQVSRLELSAMPSSHMEGPDYLGVLRFTDISNVLAALGDRLK